jgi:hypothetical protein
MKRMTVILMLAGSIATVVALQANAQSPDPALLAPGSSLTPQIEPLPAAQWGRAISDRVHTQPLPPGAGSPSTLKSHVTSMR